MGRVSALTAPGGVTQTDTYDARGNLSKQTGAAAEATTGSGVPGRAAVSPSVAEGLSPSLEGIRRSIRLRRSVQTGGPLVVDTADRPVGKII
jgi:YD repeat-containing protein